VTLENMKRSGLFVHLRGLVGVLFLGIAVSGLLGAFEPEGQAPVAAAKIAAASATDEPVATAEVAVVDESTPVTAAPCDKIAPDEPYPLEVGRYWVYVSEDAEHGTRTEVERRIVRRESRPDQELYYFSDGTVAFREDDKIFEMGPEGGVNVIPLNADPYVYRSQGLHTEKHVGNKDTVMILGQQRFAHCVQVITRFRPIDQPEQDLRAYASYSARGIGLVGREMWPPEPGGTPSQILRDYGPQKL
jgi:hypothetical protein